MRQMSLFLLSAKEKTYIYNWKCEWVYGVVITDDNQLMFGL